MTTLQGVSAKAASVVFLYKEGITGALLRTTKPKGIALRKWLRREVFPALEQDGSYSLPGVEPTEADAIDQGEQRAQARHERELRRHALAALDRALDEIGEEQSTGLTICHCGDRGNAKAVEAGHGRESKRLQRWRM